GDTEPAALLCDGRTPHYNFFPPPEETLFCLPHYQTSPISSLHARRHQKTKTERQGRPEILSNMTEEQSVSIEPLRQAMTCCEAHPNGIPPRNPEHHPVRLFAKAKAEGRPLRILAPMVRYFTDYIPLDLNFDVSSK